MIVVTVTAEGALARLAHDIRIEARGGTIERDGDVVRARFPAEALRVIATSRHGKDRFGEPSQGDAREIEKRMRAVLPEAIEVVGTKESIAVNGRQTVRPRDLEVTGDRVRGTCTLSLAALGIEKVEGPLGAIRTADAIEVEFDVALG